MTPPPCPHGSELTRTFSLFEKGIARIGFYGFIFTGIYGVFVANPILGIVYGFFAMIGLVAVLLRCLCSHCPYPHKYGTCPFFPAEGHQMLFRWRRGPLNALERAGFFGIFSYLILVPQYWLSGNTPVLVLFWVLCLLGLAPYPMYHCFKCRHVHCPINRTGIARTR